MARRLEIRNPRAGKADYAPAAVGRALDLFGFETGLARRWKKRG